MKKIIAIEVDVCDICQEKQVARYYHNEPVTCEWCGKVLCSACSCTIGDRNTGERTACPECKATVLSLYVVLKKKAEDLEKQYRATCAEAEAELRDVMQYIKK